MTDLREAMANLTASFEAERVENAEREHQFRVQAAETKDAMLDIIRELREAVVVLITPGNDQLEVYLRTISARAEDMLRNHGVDL